MEARIELPGTAEQLDTVMGFLSAFWGDADLPPGGQFPFELSLEELFMNVAMHGSAGSDTPRTVVLALHAAGSTVTAVIEDDGIAFDPLNAPPPDLDSDIEDRPIGGLGVYLVKEMMDQVDYARADGRNRVTLVKNVAE